MLRTMSLKNGSTLLRAQGGVFWFMRRNPDNVRNEVLISTLLTPTGF